MLFSDPVIANGKEILEANKSKCNWLSTYGFVSMLIDEIGATEIVEIGVAYGYHAEYLLDRHRKISYIGVDPYRDGYDPNDSFSTDVKSMFKGTSNFMDLLYICVARNLERHMGRATLVRRTSEDASRIFRDKQLDIVYIDGDHRPESVARDVRAWLPKIRPGGILCGDDFNWPGTPEVLQKFATEIGAPLIGYRDQNNTIVKWSLRNN